MSASKFKISRNSSLPAEMKLTGRFEFLRRHIYYKHFLEITAKIGQLQQLKPLEVLSASNDIKKLLMDGEDLLEQMELSVREIEPNKFFFYIYFNCFFFKVLIVQNMIYVLKVIKMTKNNWKLNFEKLLNVFVMLLIETNFLHLMTLQLILIRFFFFN
jgi:hypothetical protein